MDSTHKVSKNSWKVPKKYIVTSVTPLQHPWNALIKPLNHFFYTTVKPIQHPFLHTYNKVQGNLSGTSRTG